MKRTTFAWGVAGGLLALAGCCGAPRATDAADGRVDRSRIGVCSWSWRLPVRGVAEQMDKCGVRGIQLALGPFLAPDGRHGNAEGAEALSFVKGKIARGEWKIMSTMIAFHGEDYSTLESIRRTGGMVPDRHWAANQRLVTAGARLTQELGCTYMAAHAGFLDESDPKAFKTYVSRVTWIRDECRRYGVTFLLESGQETAEDLAGFLARVPGLGVNFDPANMILYDKGRPMEALKVLLPWIRQIHVKDGRRTKVPGTWGDETPWGEGEVGGAAFIAALEGLGYTGNYVVEREGGDNRAGDIARAVNALAR